MTRALGRPSKLRRKVAFESLRSSAGRPIDALPFAVLTPDAATPSIISAGRRAPALRPAPATHFQATPP